MTTDNETVRAEAESPEASPSAFDQAFDDAIAASGSEEARETEATEPEAEHESAESSADDAEEAAPTAEELGLDTSTPEGKRLYKAALSHFTKWVNKHRAKESAAPEPVQQAEAPPPQAAQPTGETDDPIEAVYNIDFESFKPSEGIREKFAEYDDGIYDLVVKTATEIVQHARDQFRNNDRTLAFRNQGVSGRNSFGITLRGTAGNPTGIGAKITLRGASVEQRPAITSGQRGWRWVRERSSKPTRRRSRTTLISPRRGPSFSNSQPATGNLPSTTPNCSWKSSSARPASSAGGAAKRRLRSSVKDKPINGSQTSASLRCRVLRAHQLAAASRQGTWTPSPPSTPR